MKRKIAIELFEEHERVNFYAIRFDGEDFEIDQFLDKYFVGSYIEDCQMILSDIGIIGKKGALIRDFRLEGKPNDRLYALPSYWISHCKLRLFCLLINKETVILGNGYKKTNQPYDLNPIANYYAETLLSIDKLLRIRMDKEKIHLYRGQFFGDLSFNIEDERPKEE